MTWGPSPAPQPVLSAAKEPPSPRFAGRGTLNSQPPSPLVRGEKPALSDAERSEVESKGARRADEGR